MIKTIKKYWKWLVLVIMFPIMILVITFKKDDKIPSSFLESNRERKKEHNNKMSEIRKKEIEEHNQSIKDYIKKRDLIENDHVSKKRKLTEREKYRVDCIMKNTENDPDKLAEQISKEFGFNLEG